jgi:hypothetical protein
LQSILTPETPLFPSPPPAAARTNHGDRPANLPDAHPYWTGRLFDAGFSIREASRIHRMPIVRILDDAERLTAR